MTPKSSPVQVPGTSWTEIDTIGNHTLARKTDNTLWIFGDNNHGQVGNGLQCGTGFRASSPIQVPGNSWSDIGGGSTHSAARKTDGTLWVWGQGAFGQLGNNNQASICSPVQIPGTSWNDISAGGYFNLARKTDGTLWSWGLYSSGRLGINSALSRSSPIQIPGTSWNDILAGDGIAMARKCVP